MRKVLSVLIATVITVSVFAGGNTEQNKTAKLTIWINGSDSFIGPIEQQNPQDQWYISKAIKRFEAANPGVKVELVVQADASAAHTSFKAAGLAGNAPDVANLWTGQPIFALKDVILPLDKYIPANDLKELIGWESLRDGFKPDGSILGYPAGQNQICFMMYNKSIIRKAGLDWDTNPPKTVSDFDRDLEKIKSLGVTPILVDEGSTGVNWFFIYIADYWWAQMTGNQNIIKETTGEKKFANDVGFIKVLEYYHSLYTNGYLRKDLATSVDSQTLFFNGKGAIYPAVTSYLADAEKALGPDLGILMPPEFSTSATLIGSTIGGPGQCLVVSKNSQNPELAIKLIRFLNSKAEVIEALKTNSYPVVRTDISLQEVGWKAGSNIAKINSYSSKYNYWVDNLLPSNVAEIFYSQGCLVATGKLSPKEFAEAMDKKAAGQ